MAYVKDNLVHHSSTKGFAQRPSPAILLTLFVCSTVHAFFFVMAMFKILTVATAAALLGICAGQQLTFSNPIHDKLYEHPPSVFHLGSKYYIIVTDLVDTTTIEFYESDVLTNFTDSRMTSIYPLGPPKDNEPAPILWSPKLHMLDGELYMYLAVDEDGLWKMYGLKAENASDPMGAWGPATKMLTDWDQSTRHMDGTLMVHNGKNYFLWASERLGPRSIYIAEMSSPYETKRPYVLLKYPTEEWECEGRCTSEAPYVIHNGNVSYMILTTSAPHHIMTRMSIPMEKDPMDPNNWDFIGEPVFDKNDEEKVFNPGHCSFTDSPDGTETWMLFVGNEDPDALISTVRIEKIDWNEDGTPSFPKAHGDNQPMPVPSGQTHT